MGLLNILVVVALAIAGGAVSFGLYKLKQKLSRKSPEDDAEQNAVTDTGLDPEVPFPDLVDSVTFEAPPAPSVDMSSEFASLHKSLREIAKAQVSMIEAGQGGGEDVETDKLEEALTSLQSFKDETQSLIEGVSERLDKMSEQLASGADTADTQPQNTEFLELLEKIDAKPEAPEIGVISDLLLPQIALLGEDLTKLAAKIENSDALNARMDKFEELLQGIADQTAQAPDPLPADLESSVSDAENTEEHTQQKDPVGSADADPRIDDVDEFENPPVTMETEAVQAGSDAHTGEPEPPVTEEPDNAVLSEQQHNYGTPNSDAESVNPLSVETAEGAPESENTGEVHTAQAPDQAPLSLEPNTDPETIEQEEFSEQKEALDATANIAPDPAPEPNQDTETEKPKGGVTYIPAGATEPLSADDEAAELQRLMV